jgi:hypothetical protein
MIVITAFPLPTVHHTVSIRTISAESGTDWQSAKAL